MKHINVICIIPARGGSKGIPRKNVRLLAGKPLIVHSIEQSRLASSICLTVVSTDDDEIAEISTAAGAKVIRRPFEISGDDASSESAVIHTLSELALENIVPDLVVFLQCTSPIRTFDDIDKAVARLIDQNADSLLSVSPNHRFLWAEVEGKVVSLNYDFHNRPRRQDMPLQYVENGSIYVFRREIFMHHKNRLGGKVAIYIMDEDASWDIDTAFDMHVAEMLMLERAAS